MGAVNIVLHEFRAMKADMKRAPGLKNKLGYMLNPPGWSHDGSTQIAKVMQRDLQEAEQQKQKPFKL